jgi:hypothetical protein
MIKNTFFVVIFLLSSFSSPSFGQTSKGASNLGESSLKDLIIVGGTGSMGAILGLSTLSFVEEPSEHLKNVYMGASLGIILGVSFVAYQTANREQENLVRLKRLKNQLTPDFKTSARLSWHKADRTKLSPKYLKNQVLNLNFEF